MAPGLQTLEQMPQWMQASGFRWTFLPPLMPRSFSSALRQLFWQPVTPNLNLPGKIASEVALIEHRCDLVGIDVARGADSAALAACDRAYARSAAARLDTVLGEHRLRGICILDIDEGDLDGLAARQMDVAMAEGVGHLGDANELV